MNKIIVVVANNNECIESLKKAGDSIGVEIKSEIQSDGKIINDPVDSSGAHRTRFISTGFILTKK